MICISLNYDQSIPAELLSASFSMNVITITVKEADLTTWPEV